MAKPDKVDVYFVLNDPPPAQPPNLTVEILIRHRSKDGKQITAGRRIPMTLVRGSPRTFLARNVRLRDAGDPPDDRVLVRVTATATVDGRRKTLAKVDAPSPDNLVV